MCTLRPFTAADLLKINEINLDPLTETYGMPFYMQYLALWPEYFRIAVAPNGDLMGYRIVGFFPFLGEASIQTKNSAHFNIHVQYGMQFYMQYLAHWPEYFQIAVAPNGDFMGYIMGKAEGRGSNWHGHVTALTVSPKYRRLGVAAALMKSLEEISERKNCYFVDLFVRVSNKNAITMYEKLGYTVYRTVLEYYSGDPDENAFDMRKALSRDVEQKSVIPVEHPVRPEDVDG